MTTIALKYPVKHGSEDITELTLRRPKSKDFRKYKQNDLENFSTMIELISSLCGLPISVISEIDFYDFTVCSKAIMDFLQSSQQTLENV